MMIDTGHKGTEKYSWICADQQCDTIDCFKDPLDHQTVCKLWEVSELSAFHDEPVADATKKINAILSRLIKGNTDKSRKLSFVHHRGRFLLVWANYGRISAEDDFKTIRKSLKLKK
jgi:hypothetical protein